MSTKRADGRLQKSVTIDGERIFVYGHNEREIRDKIDQLYNAKYRGITPDTLFRDYAAHWLDVTLPDKAINTQIGYKRAVKHLIEELGDMPIADIKRSQLEKALNNHSDKPTSRNQMLLRARAIFNLAIDDEICTYNPALNIKHLKTDHGSRDRLTPAEINAVKSADLPPMERLFVDILYHTGIRRGEALAISRKSLGKGVLYIREQTVFTDSGAAVLTPLKTHNASRDIPIPPTLENEIRAYIKACDSIYLFEPMRSRHRFASAWYRIRLAIHRVDHPGYNPKRKTRYIVVGDIPCRLTPHFFRHNYASALYDNHIDIKTAQKLLGHASINTTLGIYTHLAKESQIDSFEAVREMSAAM